MSHEEVLFTTKIQWGALLSTLLLFGSYPMTQVYQHDEDGKRGDITLSLILGVLGTFHFTAICFTVSVALYVLFFNVYFSLTTAVIFTSALSPVLVYFGMWYLKVRKSLQLADYDHTMKLNLISSACLNAFFLYLSLN